MDIKKFNQFTKKEQAEIEDIYHDGFKNGFWTIVLKNHDRVISEDKWSEVKWELKEMVKRNDYTLQW